MKLFGMKSTLHLFLLLAFIASSFAWANPAAHEELESSVPLIAPTKSEPIQPNPHPTDAKEQYILGKNYERGNGVPEDQTEAIKWYRKAADQGFADERAEGVFRDLVACYLDENRAYHNLSHIDRMLSWLDDSGETSDSVELAIWFHDAIYEPLGSHNEAKSAQYFADRLGAFIGGELAKDVQRLILATDPTRSRSGRKDEDLIIDIDLGILGSPPEDYEAYKVAVRSEYSSVSDSAFSAGRSLILQRFLSQQIYATGFFVQLEERARLNIKRELETLKIAKS